MLKRYLSRTSAAFLLGIAFNFLPTFSYSQSEISSDPEIITSGKKLFDANCKQCHKINERLIGPALQDVYNRAPSLDWILAFIKNPTKMVQSGDAYANDLFDEYKTMMTAFPLEDEQIMSILAYIKNETEKEPEVVAAPTETGSAAETTSESVPSAYLNYILIGLVIVLFLIFGVLLLILGIIKRYLGQQEISEEDQELVNQSFSLGDFVRSKPVVFITIFLLTAVVTKGVINGLYSIGVQKGYAPTQPIAYSHKLHAGDYGIDCNYCHTGVRKSRSANIPSANICMNCHSSILTESPEIKKIYAAIENDKPIEWVRIHNLPDLAYFNHSQHVVVGELECQTCHGPIEEMEVVQQQELLTMGWCVNCHRTTEVKSKDNAYYEKLLEYHEGDQMTVEDIGGLECAKCHY